MTSLAKTISPFTFDVSLAFHALLSGLAQVLLLFQAGNFLLITMIPERDVIRNTTPCFEIKGCDDAEYGQDVNDNVES